MNRKQRRAAGSLIRIVASDGIEARYGVKWYDKILPIIKTQIETAMNTQTTGITKIELKSKILDLDIVVILDHESPGKRIAIALPEEITEDTPGQIIINKPSQIIIN